MQKPKFDSLKHHRRSIRVKGYDYSQEGAYYVTIVTYQRDCLFGEIKDEEMHLNDFGKIADECWRAIPEHFPFVELGAYVVMPNHMHGIILITDDHGTATNLSPFVWGDPMGRPYHARQSSQGTKAKIFGRNHRIIQIRRFISHQEGIYCHRYLATQLLRTHHPRRERPGKQNRLHRSQLIVVG
jgi:REP element-mobilizing transposase RayT